jgi:4-amino-4-deoxy-L-arabinose transferase-like glycosyltransferase
METAVRPFAWNVLAPVAVFAAALACFAAGAGERGLWPPDEPRYAEVAREMLAGGGLLLPQLDARPYAEKPPAFFWLEAAALRALGGGDVAPRVPSMIFGAAGVALVFVLARRLLGAAGGIAAAGALVSTLEFAFLAQRANIDATLTFFTTLAIYASVRAAEMPAPGRSPARWHGLAYAATGIAVLVKGPAGALVPALACGGAALARGGPRALARRHVLWGSALVLAMVALWLVPAALHARGLARAAGEERPWGYVEDLVLRNAAGHAFRADEGRDGPPWFYAASLLAGGAPWWVLWPAALLAIARWREERWRAADALAIAWTAPVVVAFSLLRNKRDLYLLPAYPGLALLAGIVAARVAAAPERARHPLVRSPLALVFAGLAAGGAALEIAAAALPRGLGDALAARIPGFAAEVAPAITPRWLAAAALLGAAGLTAGALGLRALGRHSPAGTLAAAIAGGLVLALGLGLLALPLADPTTSTRAIAARASALARDAGEARIATYGPPDEGDKWMFYLERAPLAQLHTPAELGEFLSPDNISPAIVIALDHPDLPGEPLARGAWRRRHRPARERGGGGATPRAGRTLRACESRLSAPRLVSARIKSSSRLGSRDSGGRAIRGFRLAPGSGRDALTIQRSTRSRSRATRRVRRRARLRAARRAAARAPRAAPRSERWRARSRPGRRSPREARAPAG